MQTIEEDTTAIHELQARLSADIAAEETKFMDFRGRFSADDYVDERVGERVNEAYDNMKASTAPMRFYRDSIIKNLAAIAETKPVVFLMPALKESEKP